MTLKGRNGRARWCSLPVVVACLIAFDTKYPWVQYHSTRHAKEGEQGPLLKVSVHNVNAARCAGANKALYHYASIFLM